MKRILVSAALILVGALGLAGCSAGGYESSVAPQSAGDYFDGGVAESPELAYEPSRDDSGGAQVITRGSLTVTVESPNESADLVARVVTAAGGHVAQRHETLPRQDQPGRASLVLRIPSAQLDDVLGEIKSLGETRDINIGADDVTMIVRDLDSRIAAMQTSVDRLIALLAQADKTADLIEIEAALSNRQGELESMLSQRRSLQDQVSLSTIQLELIAPAETPVDDPNNFLTGLAAGWDAFVAFWSTVLVLIGVMAPWIVTFALIAAVVIFWVRSRSRKAGERPSIVETTPAPPVS